MRQNMCYAMRIHNDVIGAFQNPPTFGDQEETKFVNLSYITFSF